MLILCNNTLARHACASHTVLYASQHSIVQLQECCLMRSYDAALLMTNFAFIAAVLGCSSRRHIAHEAQGCGCFGCP